MRILSTIFIVLIPFYVQASIESLLEENWTHEYVSTHNGETISISFPERYTVEKHDEDFDVKYFDDENNVHFNFCYEANSFLNNETFRPNTKDKFNILVAIISEDIVCTQLNVNFTEDNDKVIGTYTSFDPVMWRTVKLLTNFSNTSFSGPL